MKSANWKILSSVSVIIILSALSAYFLAGGFSETEAPPEVTEGRGAAVEKKTLKTSRTRGMSSEIADSITSAGEQVPQKPADDTPRQEMIRKLAVTEGITDENVSVEDLSPELQEFIKKPDPHNKEHQKIFQKMQQVGENDQM